MASSDVQYPWATVNAANFVTVKPSLKENESSNFNVWKKQVLCLLESQGLLGFVNGEIREPQASNVENEKKLWTFWRRTDKLVQGWILGSIGNDALDAVADLETSREVWLELHKIFKSEVADSEIQPESIANAQGEGGETAETGGDSSRYLQLYKAAQRGEWETAKYFFDKDREASTAIISSDLSETALHAAVMTGKANDFVKKLVDLMPPYALALQNRFGNTALHYAAMVGNTEAAIALVNKNPDLLYIVNADPRLPANLAAVFGQKDILAYLLKSMTKPNVEHTPFEGQLGIRLLNATIASDIIDVALDLVEKYPNLALLRDYNDFGKSALSVIAESATAFASGESFSWLQNLIYHRIPLKQPKQKAAQATSVAGDIEHLAKMSVPHIKEIKNKKAKHQQALELVRYLCQQMLSLPEKEASNIFHNSIITATRNGINEIVEVIIEMYPVAASAVDGTGRNVFQLAACYRFENIFNLIYNMSDRKYTLSNNVDHEWNNLMHVCANLAPPKRLNLVPGAALQMQRELQWFKVEKFVLPSRRIWINRKIQTPQMLFTEEHQQLKVEGERWMKDTANACTIAAALIATVVFAAAFTVPGGVATETGNPIFSNQPAFVLFAISDAVSLFTSITSLLMFLSILTSRYAEEDFLYVLPKRLSIGLLSLFISITFMMAAFSATLYLVFRRKMAWFFMPVAAFACLPVTSFVLLQFPLLVDVIYSTDGPGIFGKKSDRVLY